MTNDLEAVQTWLQSSYSVQVPPDWLSACVEWIQQENGGQSLSVNQLKPLVFEQWLLSDLKELGAACLPADLPSMHCTDLSGPLALQVESVLDVGVPLYGQLQKVKGTLNANSDVSADKPQQPPWEPKPSRMMLLKMTDGQTEVQGMEYQPVPAFTSNLQPGVKVVIHGQVRCRRGVLMLTADNVQVLGGEVDSLIEANTPVAVLERAMELGATNNGKHAKKDFSGRFLKKQDYKSGCQDTQEKKFKTELTPSSLQGQASTSGQQYGAWRTGNQSWRGDGVKNEPGSQSHAWSGGGGVKNERRSQSQKWNSGGVKQEPPPQPRTPSHDDEWEEDLDYGGLLDEPMEEDLPPAVSEASATSTATPQDSRGPVKKNPFACASGATAAKPQKPWQDYHSANRMISEGDTSGQQSGSSSWGSEVTNRLSAKTGQESANCTDMATDSGQRVNQTSSLQENNSALMDQSNWGDDDDFDLAQVEADVLSPVIPVQTPFVQNRQNTEISDAGVARRTSAQKSLGSSATRSNANFGNSALKAGANSTARPSLVTQTTSKPASPPKSQKSCDSTKPPPAKQRKLTAMFSRVTAESRPANEGSSPHHVPDAVVDLTEDGAVSSDPNAGINSATLKGVGSVKQDRKDWTAGASCSPPESAVTTAGRVECQDVDMAEESYTKGDHQTACASQNETIPRAAMPPLNSQGEPESSSPSPELQTLKNVLSALQCDTDSQLTFTIKGYIATLTDRLRSCQGEQWSLSCRVTDGTAALDIAIADTVLAGLIGFTAKESLTLRQQARKDAAIKDFLTQGLQKCQQYLIEFSGLIDVQRGKGDSKPSLVKMVKLETKKR